MPCIRFADWVALPAVAEYQERCLAPAPVAKDDGKEEEYPSDPEYETSDRGDAIRFMDYAYRMGAPLVWVPDAGAFYQSETGILLDIASADGLRLLYHDLPSIAEIYAAEMAAAGKPKSAKRLIKYRRFGDTRRRLDGVAVAVESLGERDKRVRRSNGVGRHLTAFDLDQRVNPTPILRTTSGALDMSTGCILETSEAYQRLVTSRMPLTPYSPDVHLPPDAERLAHIIREAWGPGVVPGDLGDDASAGQTLYGAGGAARPGQERPV